MKSQPLSVPPFMKQIFRLSHTKLTLYSDNCMTTLKLWVGYFLATYLCHKPWQMLVLRKESRDRATVGLQFHMCTGLAPRSMTVVFGLGTRLRVRMHTTLENGVLCNGQQPRRAVNNFFDQINYIRKWRPMQRTATEKSCQQLLWPE